jgi:tripartite ATP-independent transporter DctM subunit
LHRRARAVDRERNPLAHAVLAMTTRMDLNALERRCVAFAQRVAAIAVAGMLALSLLTTFDIGLRYFFNAPIEGLDEAVQFLMAVVITATLPAGIALRNHITIDFLSGTLGPRSEAVVAAIGGALVLAFMALLAGHFGVYANRLMLRQEVTLIAGIPVAPFWWAVTGLIGVCVPIQAVVFLTQAREAVERLAAQDPGKPAARRAGARAGALILVACLAVTAGLYYVMLRWGAGLSPTVLAVLALAAVWVPILILVPVGVAMAFAGLVGSTVLTTYDAAANTMVIQSASFLSNINLAALPLFLMMGSFAAVADLSSDVYRLAHALLGHWRGGLAMATIGGCAGFGAVTGSSVATAATIGRVALPEMEARGYAATLSTGCVAAGGTLGNLVPPGSGPIVIFALLAEASIGQLFIASVGPAILAVALYLATIWLFVRFAPHSAPGRAAKVQGELGRAALGCGPVALLFGVVLGGLYTGVFTATESAAVGASGAFFIALLRGKLGKGAFWSVMSETTATTAVIYGLILGALIFSFFTGVSGLTEAATKLVTGLDWPPLAVIALLLAFYIALGTFMDSYTVMIVSVPIVTPLVVGMGYDIVWWGILMLCVVETGAITPPFGLNMFVLKGMGNVPMSVIFKGVTPFVAADIVRIAILVLFPAITLWLPSTMFR